ncbi:MAG: hypothetical protein IJZ83_07415 [Clostridia bacterium]|nr:hypothetical protein [Clostridia bacterium]
MNNKKKILSFALACLMIVMTFSAAIPAFAEIYICQIGETPYTDLDAAFEAATAGQTVEILTDITVEKINTANKNAFTVKPAESVTGGRVKLTLTSDSIVSSGSTTANNITFENIDFVQPSTSTNAIVHTRGGSVYTFDNCTFEVGGYSQSMGAHFVAGQNGGTLAMNDCEIEYNGADTTNVMFASQNDAWSYIVNINNVSVSAASVAKVMFRLCTKMTVNVYGITSFDSNGGDMFIEATFQNNLGRHGGTVNVFNGMTYGVYGAPVLADGAAIRTVAPAGLRFTAKRVNANASCGFLLAKYGNEFDANVISGYHKEEITNFADDGTYMLSLVGIPDNTQQFAVRAYAEYTAWSVDNNGTPVEAKINVYSAFDADKNVRSINQVADLIVEEAKAHTTAEGVYKYEVGENMYSRYTKTQYDYIVANFATKENAALG